MATKTKATTMGNYICKENGCDIRMKVTYKKSTARGESNKSEVASHEFVVCRGRKVLKNGLKTKDEAVAFAKTV